MATMRKIEQARHAYRVDRSASEEADLSLSGQIVVTAAEWRTLCQASETQRVLPESVLNVLSKKK